MSCVQCTQNCCFSLKNPCVDLPIATGAIHPSIHPLSTTVTESTESINAPETSLPHSFRIPKVLLEEGQKSPHALRLPPLGPPRLAVVVVGVDVHVYPGGLLPRRVAVDQLLSLFSIRLIVFAGIVHFFCRFGGLPEVVLEVQSRYDGSAHGSISNVFQVGDVALDLGRVAFPQWQPPHLVTHAAAHLLQRPGDLWIVAEDARHLTAQRHSCCPGEGGTVDDQCWRVRLAVCVDQCIGKDEAAFGVGVQYLRCKSVPGGDDIAGTVAVAAHAVLHSCDEDPQAYGHWVWVAHDGLGHPQHYRRTPHVFLHCQHTCCRLQVEPARVEAHPFANQSNQWAGRVGRWARPAQLQ
mmetsp:Transcript_2458/g.6496  ORF Transcript_2458/g.6496 Transcript_2458/m.6496 type:complete len:351 (+) Transcript_2458:90-1142(+)